MYTQSNIESYNNRLEKLSNGTSKLTGDGTPSDWQEQQRKIEAHQEYLAEKARWAI